MIKAVLKASDSTLKVCTTGLRNQHAVENRAIGLLERQVRRLANYPAMRDRMRTHFEESREQARRPDELPAALDISASSIKDAAMSFVGNMAAMIHAPAPDEVVKTSFANFAFEHHEIMAPVTLTKVVRHDAAVRLLGQCCARSRRWRDGSRTTCRKRR